MTPAELPVIVRVSISLISIAIAMILLAAGGYAIISFPIAFVHEATHYLVSKPWVHADESGIQTSVRDGEASARLVWKLETPRWALVVGHLAPTIAGVSLGGVFSAWWLTSGWSLPTGLTQAFILALCLWAWAKFTTPSKADLLGWQEVGE